MLTQAPVPCTRCSHSQGCFVKPSPPTIAKVKNESSYTPPPPLPQYDVIAFTGTSLFHFTSGESHA